MTSRPIFTVHASFADRGTGTFDTIADTKEAALSRARALSDQGFLVKISGPDGEVVTGDDNDQPAKL